jgi:hypothetical protein
MRVEENIKYDKANTVYVMTSKTGGRSIYPEFDSIISVDVPILDEIFQLLGVPSLNAALCGASEYTRRWISQNLNNETIERLENNIYGAYSVEKTRAEQMRICNIINAILINDTVVKLNNSENAEESVISYRIPQILNYKCIVPTKSAYSSVYLDTKHVQHGLETAQSTKIYENSFTEENETILQEVFV